MSDALAFTQLLLLLLLLLVSRGLRTFGPKPCALRSTTTRRSASLSISSSVFSPNTLTATGASWGLLGATLTRMLEMPPEMGLNCRCKRVPHGPVHHSIAGGHGCNLHAAWTIFN
jgi:hypothetical protein